MILVYAFALYYALACVVKIYEAIEDRKLVRAKRVPVNPLPPPVPSKQVRYSEPDDSWLISHDETLRFLSPSLVAEFTKPTGTPSSVPSRITLVTERSEVTSTGSPQRLPNRP